MSQKTLFVLICTLTFFFQSMCLEARSLKRTKNPQKGVDLVVFSYNRPLQLYALLESCAKNVTGIHKIHVIYRSDSQDYTEAYDSVFSKFSYIVAHKQSSKPSEDFQKLVINSVYDQSSKADYVIFAVDDDIVHKPVNLIDCAKAIEEKRCWAFYLRLGMNITYTYTINKKTPPPRGKDDTDFFIWRFQDADEGDWNYPNNVDMTLYRKSDIAEFLQKDVYFNPNSLEFKWTRWKPRYGWGICYQESKIVNIPLNIVNNSHNNRHMNLFSVPELLSLYKQGKKIDLSKIEPLVFSSLHVPYEPSFVDRK